MCYLVNSVIERVSKISQRRQIPYYFTYMHNLRNRVNEQTKQKQTHRYKEQVDGCQMGEGLGRWMKKVKGLRSTNWQLQNSHGDVKYSIGNIVSNTVIMM